MSFTVYTGIKFRTKNIETALDQLKSIRKQALKNMANSLLKHHFYGLASKMSDHLKDDIAEVGEDFARFFSTIKEYTYDYLVERWGETTTNLLLLALVFLLIMWVATVLINK